MVVVLKNYLVKVICYSYQEILLNRQEFKVLSSRMEKLKMVVNMSLVSKQLTTLKRWNRTNLVNQGKWKAKMNYIKKLIYLLLKNKKQVLVYYKDDLE